ncbi:hypothetical protein SCLCIDRAFT_597350 [Scleroderma citrinum Foug A]|uniref:Uncharacterized protein n=1 Tax=Scleroderma citrinum Foug A TaxID=1036808 RepID=A0A0C3DW93_9AGAM|nr:hypothetical protein SCLCIDRAFT_597350 [Scleroderma citrinum Foug A]
MLLHSLNLSLSLCGLLQRANLSFMIVSQRRRNVLLQMSRNPAVEITPVAHKLCLYRSGTSSSIVINMHEAPRCTLTCTKEDPYRGQRFILDTGTWSSIIDGAQIT